MHPLFYTCALYITMNKNTIASHSHDVVDADRLNGQTAVYPLSTGCLTTITLDTPEPDSKPWFMAMIITEA